VKRYDIAISWLMAALQILHWFNPFVWYAFYRIRAERELACDELAMARLAGDASDYGRTIVCLLERFAQPRALPNLAGILEDKKQMKRRIAMISQFHPGTGSRWILAAALLAGLAAVALTNAKGPDSSPSAKAPEAVRQFDRAEKAFREALSAPAADRTRKFTEVLELYKTVHAKYSGNKDLAENSLVGMGLCYDGLGNTTEAAKALDAAVKVIGFSGTWYHLGVMREKLGQKDLADAAFLKCVVIDLRQKGNLDGFPLKNALEKIKGQAEKLKLLDHGSVVRAYNLQARLIDNYGSIRDLHYTVTTEYEEPNASRNSVEEVWVKFPANGTPAPNPLFPIKVRRGAVYKDMEVRQNNETIKGFQSREILAGGVVRSTLWPASAPDRTDTETMPVEKRIGRWELFDSVLLYDYVSAQSQTSGRIDLWSERGILTVDEKALRPVKLVSFRPEKGLELEQEITEFHEYPDRKFAFPKTIRVKLYQPGQVTPHAVGVRRVTNLKINSDLPDSLFDPTH